MSPHHQCGNVGEGIENLADLPACRHTLGGGGWLLPVNDEDRQSGGDGCDLLGGLLSPDRGSVTVDDVALDPVLRRAWRFDGSDRVPDALDIKALHKLVGWNLLKRPSAISQRDFGNEIDERFNAGAGATGSVRRVSPPDSRRMASARSVMARSLAWNELTSSTSPTPRCGSRRIAAE